MAFHPNLAFIEGSRIQDPWDVSTILNGLKKNGVVSTIRMPKAVKIPYYFTIGNFQQIIVMTGFHPDEKMWLEDNY